LPTAGLWDVAVGCLQGLRTLYERSGRDSEWARLVADLTPEFVDPATGGPLPGRDDQWSTVTGYRVRLARNARDWPTATTLQNALIAWYRDQAAAALAAPAASLTPDQRNQIRSLAVALSDLGNILLLLDDPGCLPHFQEALTLDQRISDREGEAQDAGSLGNAHTLPRQRNLDQAEHWYQHSLSLRDDNDLLGRARCLDELGRVALMRFDDARAAGETEPVLLEHLNAALHSYQEALDITPPHDHGKRAITENGLGVIYHRAGDTRNALRHYQQAIQHQEARGDIYEAGRARNNIALLLADDARINDALHYARAALHNFQQAGPGAATEAASAEQLITDLQQRAR
jgi:tetratricopeptide (TPR) repeat protein